MPAPASAVARFGAWLRRKRNFYVFSLVAIGVPVWAWEVWFLRDLSTSPLWVAFLGVVSLGAALLWGFLMLRFFARQYPSMRESERSRDDVT
jgi:hypothetical protein